MKKFQGTVATALMYCTARYWLDKNNEQLRQVWGWFAIVAIAMLIITGIVSRYSHAKD